MVPLNLSLEPQHQLVNSIMSDDDNIDKALQHDITDIIADKPACEM
jgi:hypothetical protein